MQKFELGPSKGEKKKSPANKTDPQWEQLQVWREKKHSHSVLHSMVYSLRAELLNLLRSFGNLATVIYFTSERETA